MRTIFISMLVILFVAGCTNPDDLIEEKMPFEQLKAAGISQFLVMASSETLPEGFEAQLSKFGQIVKTIPEIGMVVVKPTVSDFEAKISKLRDVQCITPDLKVGCIKPVSPAPLSNPPGIGHDEELFYLQWGLDAIDAPEAWNAGYTGKGARVFIIDTGIDANHIDLSSNLNTELSKSFVPGEGYSYEGGFWSFHGTMVAGIIAAADNGVGVIGVAPDAEIVALKVLSEHDASSQLSWIFDAIVYAANNNADVINMSLQWQFDKNGFYFDENDILQKIPPKYIQNIIRLSKRAVDYAVMNGKVVIAAAGNSGENADGNGSEILLPADLENVITVSATAPDYWYGDLVNGIEDTNFDIPAHYTTYGRSITDLAAPGGDIDYLFMDEPENWWYDLILSTSELGWEWGCGTSFASPHVVGVAALIIGKNGGRMDPQKVRQQLLKTADKIDGNGQSLYFGKGRVNAYRAVTE